MESESQKERIWKLLRTEKIRGERGGGREGGEWAEFFLLFFL